MASAWNRLIGPAQRRFRHERALRIRAALPQIEGGRVIDVGGSLAYWYEVEHILKPASVVCYNISAPRMAMGREDSNPRITARLYDGVRVSPFHLLSDGDGPSYFDETQLLTRRELTALFPGGRLVEEKVLGIPKSQLVFGGAA
jgi:hypothetical protein